VTCNQACGKHCEDTSGDDAARIQRDARDEHYATKECQQAAQLGAQQQPCQWSVRLAVDKNCAAMDAGKRYLPTTVWRMRQESPAQGLRATWAIERFR
jgi:hypothetical protein